MGFRKLFKKFNFECKVNLTQLCMYVLRFLFLALPNRSLNIANKVVSSSQNLALEALEFLLLLRCIEDNVYSA